MISRFVSQKKYVSCVFLTDKATESNPHSLAYPLLLYHTTVALCSTGNLVHLALCCLVIHPLRITVMFTFSSAAARMQCTLNAASLSWATCKVTKGKNAYSLF